MQLRRRDAKKIIDEEEEYKEEIQPKKHNEKKEKQKREKYFGDNQEIKHHKTEYFEEQRIEKMLDEQISGDEHDNDIGDDTEQEDDQATSEDESKQKIKKDKKSINEPGPLDHLVEFILGDRMLSQKEYKIWLKSEQDRQSNLVYMEFNSSEGEYLIKQQENKKQQIKNIEKGNDQTYTKNLIQQIMFESLKQMKDDKVIKLDEAEEEEDRDKPKPQMKIQLQQNIQTEQEQISLKQEQQDLKN